MRGRSAWRDGVPRPATGSNGPKVRAGECHDATRRRIRAGGDVVAPALHRDVRGQETAGRAPGRRPRPSAPSGSAMARNSQPLDADHSSRSRARGARSSSPLAGEGAVGVLHDRDPRAPRATGSRAPGSAGRRGSPVHRRCAGSWRHPGPGRAWPAARCECPCTSPARSPWPRPAGCRRGRTKLGSGRWRRGGRRTWPGSSQIERTPRTAGRREGWHRGRVRPRGPCRGDRAEGTVPRGPCRGDLVPDDIGIHRVMSSAGRDRRGLLPPTEQPGAGARSSEALVRHVPTTPSCGTLDRHDTRHDTTRHDTM